MVRNKLADERAMARLKLEMVIPRVAASSNLRPPRQHEQSLVAPHKVEELQPPAGSIISEFTGVYQRVAQRMKVSPSMVSKVATGSRRSLGIEIALGDELRLLKQKLANFH
jgi:hypothetical protein